MGTVAEAQMALSHILNAEGEKLKRAIASTDDLNALLEVNQAVNRTLVDVTFLEQALYHDLEKILEICGSCKLKPEKPRDLRITEAEDVYLE